MKCLYITPTRFLPFCLLLIVIPLSLPATSAPLHAVADKGFAPRIDSALDARALLRQSQDAHAGPTARASQSLASLNAAQTSHALKNQLLQHKLPKGLPLKQTSTISSAFGLRFHPIKQVFQHHRGIDLSVRSGTPVLSTASGVIREADHVGGSDFGKYVVITHCLGFSTLYAHLQQVHVQVGARVEAHHVLGLSGNSGRSTAPHLHYEIRYRNKPIDPRSFIRWKVHTHEATFGVGKVLPWSRRAS